MFVDDVCVCQDDMACGSLVAKSVLCGDRCGGFVCRSRKGGFVVVVVVVVVAEEVKTILVRETFYWGGGQLQCSITIIFWINGYCVLV